MSIQALVKVFGGNHCGVRTQHQSGKKALGKLICACSFSNVPVHTIGDNCSPTPRFGSGKIVEITLGGNSKTIMVSRQRFLTKLFTYSFTDNR